MTVKFQGGSSAAGLERSQSHSEKEEALPAASVHTKTESKPTDALVHLTKRGMFLSGTFHFLWSIWYKLLIHKMY